MRLILLVLLLLLLGFASALEEDKCRDDNDLEPLGTIVYFAGARGRAEPIRLILSANMIPWKEDHTLVKEEAGSPTLPFGQWPLWRQEIAGQKTSTLSQMDAITRHVGRLVGWYGGNDNPLQDSRIDEILGGVESLRSKHAALMYSDKFEVDEYKLLHMDAAGVKQRNGGAHMQYLENLLLDVDEWSTGDKLSIADVQLFDVFDLHLTLFGEGIRKDFPLLAKLHERFAQLPGVAAYLQSSLRNKPFKRE